MITTGEAIKTLIQRGIRELSEKGKVATSETLFTNKAYAVFFLKLLIKIDNDLGLNGFFYQTNKEVLKKYKTANKILKHKIKKCLKHG